MEKTQNTNKWEFEDYAFTLTGILVGVLLIAPEILYSLFGIVFFGGSFGSDTAADALDMDNLSLATLNIYRLRALSPMLFLLTTTLCFIKDAFDARKTGGYTGSVFTHTFESLFEDSIYMVITTIMVFGSVLLGAMYASWLAGPITWVLFMFIFPFFRKSDDEAKIPWLLLIVFAVGIMVEIVTQAWVAFPLTWLIICFIKLVDTIRAWDNTVDTIFDVLYYAFSVVLMALGVAIGLWITSWIAFPVALLICWVLSKFAPYKKGGSEEGGGR